MNARHVLHQDEGLGAVAEKVRLSARLLLLVAFCGFGVQQARATTVTLHTEDARATLAALENPSLTREEALKVAEMHGNQAVVRKINEFKIPATTESFANALYAAAHGQQVTTLPEQAIEFQLAQPKIAALKRLLDEIDSNPVAFEKPIEERIRRFTPANAQIHLDGYIVVAGNSGGYAFGGTDFFLDIAMIDELLFAQITTTHELYHAVQGYYADSRKSPGAAVPACTDTARLFASLYEEGTANYVGEESRIFDSNAEWAKVAQKDITAGMSDLKGGTMLLELSVSALSAPKPMSFDDVYGYGFLGHGILYNIATVMAKDIAEEDGDQGITALLHEPSYEFVLRYTQLKKYGTDKDHPRLRANTIAAAKRIADGCK